MSMQERINNYWSKRAEEFSQFRLLDLAGPQRHVWSQLIKENLPKRDGKIKALDTGTGAGFYAFILADLGCETVGIDYSQDMIDQANANAAMLKYPPIEFRQMDAQSMDYRDETFDFIISRNVTWTVPEPEKVYEEWFRLLTPGGVIINIDANYGYVFKKADESGWTEKQNENWGKDGLNWIGTRPDMVRERNDIAKQLSIAAEVRPQWDLNLMLNLGFSEVGVTTNIMGKLFPEIGREMEKAKSKEENPFNEDPNGPDTRIFLLKGVK